MRGRHITTAITMTVLVVILVIAGVVGMRAFFAPIDEEDPTGSADIGCQDRTLGKGQRVTARQVRVSVFNAGTRPGLADETMSLLTTRGFVDGEISNAPSGARVSFVQVRSTRRVDPAAQLVARQFGRQVKVRVVQQDLGPGVDVVVGNGFRRLAKAKPALTLPRRSTVCLVTAS